VIYVNSQAAGANDGTSWTDAYADLQDALDDVRANDGCPCEIWIAGGIYKPDRGTGDPALAFEPPGNVSLFGGFAGWEECVDQRDRVSNETILSGDLLGDDDPSAAGQSDCCEVTLQPGCDDAECAAIVYTRRPQCAQSWDLTCALMARDWCCETCRTTFCDNTITVVRVIEVIGAVLFDGLIVGGADGNGLFSERSQVMIEKCTFRSNVVVGLRTYSGSASVSECRFIDNGLFDTWGESIGVYHEFNQGVVSDCEFAGNRGSGIVTESSAPIRRCTFRKNRGIFGAVRVDEGSPTISDSLFISNEAIDGGALLTGYPTSVRVENCIFIGNHSGIDGGGISSNSGGGLTVVNSLFVGNSAVRGGGQSLRELKLSAC